MRDAVAAAILGGSLLGPLALLATDSATADTALLVGLLAVPFVLVAYMFVRIYLDHRPEAHDVEFPYLLPEETEILGGSHPSDAVAAEAATLEAERREYVPRVEVYEDVAGEWRWRLVAANNEPIADSGEGYASKANAKRAARRTRETMSNAAIVERNDTR